VLDYSLFHLAVSAHDACLDPRQSGSGGRRLGHIKTPDGAELRFARWAPPAAVRDGLPLTGRGEQIEKYFETVRICVTRFCGGDDRLRGRAILARLRDPRKAMCAISPISSRRRNLREQCPAGLPAAFFALGHSMGARCCCASRMPESAVRPHGVVGADDRSARAPPRFRSHAVAHHAVYRQAGATCPAAAIT